MKIQNSKKCQNEKRTNPNHTKNEYRQTNKHITKDIKYNMLMKEEKSKHRRHHLTLQRSTGNKREQHLRDHRESKEGTIN